MGLILDSNLKLAHSGRALRQSDNLKGMARKTTTREQIQRIGQRRQVVFKPKRVVDQNDVLTPQESVVIAKARREMREGRYIALTRLEHELNGKRRNVQIGS